MKTSLKLICIILLTTTCALRHKSDEDGPGKSEDPASSRPDAQGVLPKAGNLGAQFANASLETSATQLTGSLKSITLPPLLKQSCSFTDFSMSKNFSWSFTSDSSALKNQSLSVDLSSATLPSQGASFTFSGSMNSSGSVTFRGVDQSSDGFGYWSTRGFKKDTQCTLTVQRIINGKGETISTPAEYSGPFQVDSLLRCHLQNFFESSSAKSSAQYLNFDAQLGCTGDSNKTMSSNFKKWFISSQMTSFELNDEKMVASLAKTFCTNSTFSNKLPTVDELSNSADEIKSNFFTGQTESIRLWATDSTAPNGLVIVDNFQSTKTIVKDYDAKSTAYVICLH